MEHTTKRPVTIAKKNIGSSDLRFLFESLIVVSLRAASSKISIAIVAPYTCLANEEVTVETMQKNGKTIPPKRYRNPS